MMSEVRSGHNIFEDCLCSYPGELSNCRLMYENCNESLGFVKSKLSGQM